MKARVHVMLKDGVLDPQGEAIRHALGSLGFEGVTGVRQGKVIELDLAPGTTEAQVDEMCRKLLANTVIESYRIELPGAPVPTSGAEERGGPDAA
ncbi:phosphoribosylformylglycinamidine synthase subunit PurS [Aestuariibius insulae]|uniref:phosphoribosylformylglycinamidine synthase subunit PurS n=1 Tax=Aestuariibius insulae TaxID=2058287 RepID=UPI00345E330B